MKTIEIDDSVYVPDAEYRMLAAWWYPKLPKNMFGQCIYPESMREVRQKNDK